MGLPRCQKSPPRNLCVLTNVIFIIILEVGGISPPYRWRNRNMERLRNLAVIKEPGRGRVGPIQAEIRASDSPRLPASSSLEKPSWTVSIPTRIHEGQPKLGSQIMWKVGVGWGLIRWGDFSSTGERSPGVEVEASLRIWAESHMTYLDFLTGKWEQSFILPARKCLGENPCCTIFERPLQRWGKQEKKKKMQNFSQETLPGVFDGCFN